MSYSSFSMKTVLGFWCVLVCVLLLFPTTEAVNIHHSQQTHKITSDADSQDQHQQKPVHHKSASDQNPYLSSLKSPASSDPTPTRFVQVGSNQEAEARTRQKLRAALLAQESMRNKIKARMLEQSKSKSKGLPPTPTPSEIGESFYPPDSDVVPTLNADIVRATELGAKAGADGGYQAGVDQGTKDGAAVGSAIGWSIGNQIGQAAGYSAGYNAGLEYGTSAAYVAANLAVLGPASQIGDIAGQQAAMDISNTTAGHLEAIAAASTAANSMETVDAADAAAQGPANDASQDAAIFAGAGAGASAGAAAGYIAGTEEAKVILDAFYNSLSTGFAQINAQQIGAAMSSAQDIGAKLASNSALFASGAAAAGTSAGAQEATDKIAALFTELHQEMLLRAAGSSTATPYYDIAYKSGYDASATAVDNAAMNAGLNAGSNVANNIAPALLKAAGSSAGYNYLLSVASTAGAGVVADHLTELQNLANAEAMLAGAAAGLSAGYQAGLLAAASVLKTEGAIAGASAGAMEGIRIGTQIGDGFTGITGAFDAAQEAANKAAYLAGQDAGAAAGLSAATGVVWALSMSGAQAGAADSIPLAAIDAALKAANESGAEYGGEAGREAGEKRGAQIGEDMGGPLGAAYGSEYGGGYATQFAQEYANITGPLYGAKGGDAGGNKEGMFIGQKIGAAVGAKEANTTARALGAAIGNRTGFEVGTDDTKLAIPEDLNQTLLAEIQEIDSVLAQEAAAVVAAEHAAIAAEGTASAQAQIAVDAAARDAAVEAATIVGAASGAQAAHAMLQTDQVFTPLTDVFKAVADEESAAVAFAAGAAIGRAAGEVAGRITSYESGKFAGVIVGERIGNQIGYKEGANAGAIAAARAGRDLGRDQGTKQAEQLARDEESGVITLYLNGPDPQSNLSTEAVIRGSQGAYDAVKQHDAEIRSNASVVAGIEAVRAAVIAGRAALGDMPDVNAKISGFKGGYIEGVEDIDEIKSELEDQTVKNDATLKNATATLDAISNNIVNSTVVDHLQQKIDLLFQAINELRIRMGYPPLRRPPAPKPVLPPSEDELAKAAAKAKQEADNQAKLALISSLEHQLSDLWQAEKDARAIDPDLDGFVGTATPLPPNGYRSHHRHPRPPHHHHQQTPHGSRHRHTVPPISIGGGLSGSGGGGAGSLLEEDPLLADARKMDVDANADDDGEVPAEEEMDDDGTSSPRDSSPIALAADDAVDKLAQRLLSQSSDPLIQQRFKTAKTTPTTTSSPSAATDSSSTTTTSSTDTKDTKFHVTGDDIIFKPSEAASMSRLKQIMRASQPPQMITPQNDDGTDEPEDDTQVDANGEVSPVQMTVARTIPVAPTPAAASASSPRFAKTPLSRLRGMTQQQQPASGVPPVFSIPAATTPQSGGIVVENEKMSPVEADTEIELRATATRKRSSSLKLKHTSPSSSTDPTVDTSSSPSASPSVLLQSKQRQRRRPPVWLEDNFVDPELT